VGGLRRLGALVAILLLVAACAAQFRPQGDHVTEPRLEQDSWIAADGARLPLRVWQPQGGAPRAVIVAVHGMNDYSNAFDGPGKALAAHSILTYAYDQRGFGAGESAGIWSDTATMADDLAAILGLARARHPGVPLFLLGESMGGAVAMVCVTIHQPAGLAGLILSAPAVWGRASMPWYQRAGLWISYKIAPGWTLTGRGLNIMPSDNIEMLRALSRDPLVIKETRVDAIHGLVDLMDAAQESVPRLGVPLLLLYGAHDEVIPAEPTWRAVAELPDLGRSQRAALYDTGWHMLLRDLKAQIVLDDIAAWTADQAAPLPSGADRRAMERLAKM
jgi:alpha-beta hydrolase superfamily lysophospholipase